MKRVSSVTRILSYLVILSFLSIIVSPGYAQSLNSTSISGRILSSDQAAPISGAIVKAADVKSKKIYESEPTAKNGYYEISGLASGTYDIAVQVGDGLYLINKLLSVGENQSHSLSLTLKDNPADKKEEEEKEKEKEKKKGKEEGEEGEKGKEGEEVITPGEAETEEERLAFWDNPMTATAAFVGIAIATGWGVDQLTDEDKRLSPF